MSDTLTLELASRPDKFVAGLKAAGAAAEAFRKKVLAVQQSVEEAMRRINGVSSGMHFGQNLAAQGNVAAQGFRKVAAGAQAMNVAVQANAAQAVAAFQAVGAAAIAASKVAGTVPRPKGPAGSTAPIPVPKLEPTARSLIGFEQVVGNVAKKIERSVFSIRTALLALGAVSIVQKIVNAGADFQDALGQIAIVANDAGKPIGEFRKELLELSKTTPTGLQDLAKAYATAIGTLPKGAQQAREAKEALLAADQAARASGSTAAETLVGITAVLNTYRKTGITATEITDKLFQTFDQGGATVPALANSIGQVAGIAATFNININELFGSIAVLTRSGQSASEAITNLRQAYISIARPPEIAAARAKELGIELGEVALRAKGLPGVLRDIENKGGKPFLSQLLTDTQGFLAASTLMAVGLEVLDDDIVRLSTSSGRTAAAVKVLEGNFSTAAGILRNKLTTVFVAMSEKVMPQLIAAFEKLGDFVVDNQEKIVEVFKAVFDAVASLSDFVIEHGKGILVFFATLFAVGRIATFSTALKQLAVLLTTAIAGPIAGVAGAGGLSVGAKFVAGFASKFPGIATALLSVLQNAGFVGALLAIAVGIGTLLVDTINDKMREGVAEAENFAKLSTKITQSQLDDEAKAKGFDSSESMLEARGKIRRGELVDTLGQEMFKNIQSPIDLLDAGDVKNLEEAFGREIAKADAESVKANRQLIAAETRAAIAQSKIVDENGSLGKARKAGGEGDILLRENALAQAEVDKAKRDAEIAREKIDSPRALRAARADVLSRPAGEGLRQEQELAKLADENAGKEENARKRLGALKDKDDEKKRRSVDLEKLLFDARKGEADALYEATARQIDIEQAQLDAREKSAVAQTELAAQLVFNASKGTAVDQAQLASSTASGVIAVQERIFKSEEDLNARRLKLVDDLKNKELDSLFDETSAKFNELKKHSDRVEELTEEEQEKVKEIRKRILAESVAKESQIKIEASQRTQAIVAAAEENAAKNRAAVAAAAALRTELFIQKGLERFRGPSTALGRVFDAAEDPLGAFSAAGEEAIVRAEKARSAAIDAAKLDGGDIAAQAAAGSSAFASAGGTGALASAGPYAALAAIIIKAPAILDGLSDLLETGIKNFVDKLDVAANRFIDTLADGLPDQMDRIFSESIPRIIENAGPNTVKLFEKVFSGALVVRIAAAFARSIPGMGVAFVKAIVGGFNRMLESGFGKYVLRPIGAFFVRLGYAFAEFFTKFYDAVGLKFIVDAMVEGAVEAWKYIGEKFMVAIQAIVDFAKDTQDFLTGGSLTNAGDALFGGAGSANGRVAAGILTGGASEGFRAIRSLFHQGGTVRGSGANARAALGLAMSGAPAFGFGGLVGAPGAATRAALGRVLGGDDVPMIGQAGEGVVNRRGMADIGEDGLARINRGQGTGGAAQVSVNLGGRRDIKALMSLILGEVSVDIASPSGQVRRAVAKTQRAPIMTTFVRRT